MGIAALAAGWGFAEATLFFIVPDVLLSWLALSNLRRALVACGLALCGALGGGSLMYVWGASDLATAEKTVRRVPGVGKEMTDKVRREVEEGGAKALFVGPLAGRPYKLYAIYAGATGTAYWAFLLVSIPARLIRFVLLASVTHLAARTLLVRLSDRGQRAVLIAAWCIFYAWYFWRLSG